MSDSDTDRVRRPQTVSSEGRAEATSLMAAIGAAQVALRDFDAPAMGTRFNLGPGEAVDDWGGAQAAPLMLICPWCGQDAHERNLYDRELSERWSFPGLIDSDERVVTISYNGGGDFDSVTLVHEPCRLPVSVPAGWELESGQ